MSAPRTGRWAGPALLAAALLLTAAPAHAASGITSPGTGEVVTAHGVLPLRAVVEGPAGGPSELSLQAPGASEATVVAVSTDPDGGELAHDLDTQCTATVCAEPQPAANGTWTLRLSGAASDERTFVLRIPPAVPEQVGATRSEAGVMVRWRQGHEPDLRGWRVEDGQGRIVLDGIRPDACDAEGQCTVEVPEAAGSWAVRAFRAACPDCRQSLASPPSAVVRAEGVQDPVAVGGIPTGPSPEGSAGPPQRRPDQAQSFRGAFGSGRPATQQQPAPPAPVRLPTLPQDDGPVDQELGYDDPDALVAEPRAPGAGPAQAVTDALSPANRLPLLLLAGGLVGASFWLRRWARRVSFD